MKFHILYPYSNESRGGGSIFLSALQAEWRSHNLYAETAAAADAILFNSHHGIGPVMLAKWRYPHKTFVHRIDGPMAAYNPGDRRDVIVRHANQHLADATIFQSAWSREHNHARGLVPKKWEMVIHNAASPLFVPSATPQPRGAKVKLLATSWSPHANKGFATYAWLDQHLDWSRYEMAFIGNSPVPFANIRQLPPLTKAELVPHLQAADIFIFASTIEACSNTLLEALACRVPVVAYAGSSNPELVGQGGVLFKQAEDIPALLERVLRDYQTYQAGIEVASLPEISQAYRTFMAQVHDGALRTHLSLEGSIRVGRAILGLL
jgi:glycosyltransferase involved in cell wall biosynthesis